MGTDFSTEKTIVKSFSESLPNFSIRHYKQTFAAASTFPYHSNRALFFHLDK